MSDIVSIDTRLRPFEAVKAVRRLMADPEDTRQVFVALAALRGRSGLRMFRRFRASPVGAVVLAERRRLLDALQDRARLERLPEGTLGRGYFDFMREAQLTPDGLVGASMVESIEGLPPDGRLFRERMRDAHDLTHVLTGYGRDGLGELCLLAFMYAHTGNLGMALMVAMGYIRAGRSPLKRPARAAIRRAYLDGRKARWMPGLDFEAMLARPLEELRRELNIRSPVRYRALTA